MKFGSLNGGEDDEHTGIGCVEISKIFEMHDTIFIRTELFGRAHRRSS